MKTKLLIGILLLSTAYRAVGQTVIKDHCSKTVTLSDELRFSNADQILRFLPRVLPELQNPNVDLVEDHQITGGIGTHYTFNQRYSGIPIWGASIRIHVNDYGKVYLVQSTLIDIPNSLDLIPEQDQNKLIQTNSGFVWGNYVVEKENRIPYERLYVNGEVIWEQEGRLHFTQKDTTAMGYVFLPNPVNSAGVKYGVPYVDSNDANTLVLREQRKLVSLPAVYRNDTFFLETKWLKITDINLPTSDKTYSLNDSFLFNRSQDQFEDVNAFYHITNMASYLTGLGFSGLIIDTIQMDAHGSFGADNSSFNYNEVPVQLEYGTGFVDDAEDGEVVIHEFGHSLSHKASPFTFVGSERRAMEEGTADYFSVSYSRQFTDYNWGSVFSWDGHNEFWNGFDANSNKNYKTDLKGSMNSDREIWSSALTCIYDGLGREVTDSLVLNYLYLQDRNTTMPQMANAMLKIDTMLWQSAYYETIKGCFVNQGILDWSVGINNKVLESKIVVANSLNWSQGNGDLLIKHTGITIKSFELIDPMGRVVLQMDSDSRDETSISPAKIPAGAYILQLNTDQGVFYQKLIRQ